VHVVYVFTLHACSYTVLNLEHPYILHCTVLYCTVLYTSVLYCFPSHFNVTVYCTVFQDTSEQDLASFDDDVIKRTKRSKISGDPQFRLRCDESFHSHSSIMMAKQVIFTATSQKHRGRVEEELQHLPFHSHKTPAKVTVSRPQN
jgi:hypothetical protein